MPQTLIHNDEPPLGLGVDPFKQKPLVESIAETLANLAQPPFVASLNGDWGQGKTSLLYAVHKQLTGTFPGKDVGGKRVNHPNVRVVWFEAWRYQHDSAPIVALLNEIRRQLDLQGRMRGYMKDAARAVFESGLLVIDSVGQTILPLSNLGSTTARSFADSKVRNHAYSLPSQSIRDVLNKAIEDVLAQLDTGANARLVVIIDDLDRCQPSVAYKLLEGLKIFLNLKSCSFLLGINRSEIVRSVAAGLKEEGDKDSDENLKLVAHEYYEKLCSYSWEIPFPTTGQVATYVARLLDDAGDSLPAVTRKAVASLIRECKTHLLPANPRRIKAWINQLLQLHAVANPASHLRKGNTLVTVPVEPDVPLMMILSSISTFHPDIHRRLLAQPELFSDFRELVISRYNEKSDYIPRNGVPWIDLQCDVTSIKLADPSASVVFRMAPLIESTNLENLARFYPHARS